MSILTLLAIVFDIVATYIWTLKILKAHGPFPAAVFAVGVQIVLFYSYRKTH